MAPCLFWDISLKQNKTGFISWYFYLIHPLINKDFKHITWRNKILLWNVDLFVGQVGWVYKWVIETTWLLAILFFAYTSPAFPSLSFSFSSAFTYSHVPYYAGCNVDANGYSCCTRFSTLEALVFCEDGWCHIAKLHFCFNCTDFKVYRGAMKTPRWIIPIRVYLHKVYSGCNPTKKNMWSASIPDEWGSQFL